MFGRFNKIMDMLTLDALKGISVNKRLELVKPKPKSIMNITLRVEKLSGKCLIEKENDLVLRNLVRILYHMFANYEAVNLPSITVTDVSGSGRTGYVGVSSAGSRYSKAATNWCNQGDIGVDTSGIVIGLGTTTPSRTDYALQSKIPHGTGTGQIYYNRQTYELLTDYSFRLNREFTNAGSDLSVAEAGLIYSTCINDTAYNILLLRDTFTPVSVTAGNGIRVRYTFSF
jgi:hypothetical protein